MLSEKVSSDALLDAQVAPDEALSLEGNDTSSKLNNIPDKAAKDLVEGATTDIPDKAEKDLVEGATTALSELSLLDEAATLLTNSLKDPAPSNPLPSTPPPSLLSPPSIDNSELSFASPLAERYFSMYFYPDRGSENPRCIEDLTLAAIRSMSAELLRSSVAESTDFPNEATFQHLFMQGLTKNTKHTTQVLPELSKVFPVLRGGAYGKIAGRIDFFVNGDLRWGIELLIKGNRRKAHRDRFSAGGKYANLNCNGFIVVDLRPDPVRSSASEQQNKVGNSSKDIMTVYFAGNFQTSSVYHSSFSSPKEITLRK